MKAYATGEDIRNWCVLSKELILFPYSSDFRPLNEPLPTSLSYLLSPFKSALENLVISGSIKKKETKLRWFEYRRLARAKFARPTNIVVPQIGTHTHFLVADHRIVFKEKAPAVVLKTDLSDSSDFVLAGFLNSAAALYWLKQICFSKRESEEGVTDTYFEFSGGKLEQLPLPSAIALAMHQKNEGSTQVLAQQSQTCSHLAQRLPTLGFKKVFEKPKEAFDSWYATLSDYVPPDPEMGKPFETSKELSLAITTSIALREEIRSKMIALQEEMDWVVYLACGFVSETTWQAELLPLKREERPFQFWARAKCDFAGAVTLIPENWPEEQQHLWRKRLELIRDNEHIRRIEQSVYKRRWDEQWKVGNRWQCGQPAYDAEFIDAFSWWLSEKAEWWLEQRGDAVSFDAWSVALWNDTRIQAAWPVVAEAQHRLGLWKNEQKKASGRPPVLDPSPTAFTKFFKALVKDQSVPEGIPFGIPYDKLRMKVSAHVKSIRGKLNVPRERFNLTAAGLYRVATPFDLNKPSDQARSSTGNNLPFE